MKCRERAPPSIGKNSTFFGVSVPAQGTFCVDRRGLMGGGAAGV